MPKTASSPRLYAARRQLRLGQEFAVLTSPSPLVAYFLDDDIRGETVRWTASHERPDSLRGETWGWETIIPGPWPLRDRLGFRYPAIPRMDFVRVDFLSEVGGVLLTAWAVWKVVTGWRR